MIFDLKKVKEVFWSSVEWIKGLFRMFCGSQKTIFNFFLSWTNGRISVEENVIQLKWKNNTELMESLHLR